MADGSTVDALGIFRSDAFAGQVVVITGGGTGLGASCAAAFARFGARTVIASRSLEHVESAAKQIAADGGVCVPVVCDVRDETQVRSVIVRAVEEFGRVDVLVNCAAGNFECAAENISVNGWRTIVDIDLTGTFLCSKAVLPIMASQGGGAIVNITASFVDAHSAGMAHAGAAKAGIDHLTRTLAKEWGGRGIRVNAVAPGPFVTEGGAELLGGESGFDEMVASLPVRRAGRHDELCAAVLFLSSSAAGFITGAALNVDGGHAFAGYRNGSGVIPT